MDRQHQCAAQDAAGRTHRILINLNLNFFSGMPRPRVGAFPFLSDTFRKPALGAGGMPEEHYRCGCTAPVAAGRSAAFLSS